jgi:hypothetical protein
MRSANLRLLIREGERPASLQLVSKEEPIAARDNRMASIQQEIDERMVKLREMQDSLWIAC